MSQFILAILIFIIIAVLWAVILLFGLKKISLTKMKLRGGFTLLLFIIVIGVGIFIVGSFMDYQNDPKFCGTTCHIMVPYYDTYLDPGNNSIMQAHLDKGITCVDCHTGPGLTGQADQYIEAVRETFNFVTGNYDSENLQGHVPAKNCMKGCHDDLDWMIEAPARRGANFTVVNGHTVWPTRMMWHPFTENGTDFTELEARESCTDCHDQRLSGIGFSKLACPICHDLTVKELELHRDQTCGSVHCHGTDKELVAHRNVQERCENCHGEEPHSNPSCDQGDCHVEAKPSGHQAETDNCMFCHDREHPDDARVPYVTAKQHGIFRMNSTFCSSCHTDEYEKLTESPSKHGWDAGCTDCHLEHKQHPNCQDCHNNVDVPIKHSLTIEDKDCQRCHVNGAHDPLTLEFPPDVANNEYCSDCHETPYDTFSNSDSKHKDNFDCVGCHDEHRESPDCLDCHTDATVEHSTTAPYENCQDCHVSGAHDPLNIQVADTCSNCHAQTVEKFETGLHSSKLCVNCHLEHATISVDFSFCDSCHSNIAPAHDETTTACGSCHDTTKIHPAEAGTGPVLQPGDEPCSTCHSGQADRLATGIHSSRDCTNCHTSGSDHGTFQVDFSICQGCHTAIPSFHNDTTTGCGNCHSDLTMIHTVP